MLQRMQILSNLSLSCAFGHRSRHHRPLANAMMRTAGYRPHAFSRAMAVS